jgi:hypothetical protein
VSAVELITTAIRREKTMKHWPRAWKLNAIEALNLEGRDLWDTMKIGALRFSLLGPRDKREDDGSV